MLIKALNNRDPYQGTQFESSTKLRKKNYDLHKKHLILGYLL